MNRIICTLLIILIFVSCQSKKKSFEFIDFAYFNNRPEAYKIRVTAEGTYYVKKDWGSMEKDLLDTFSVYKGKLADTLLETLNDIIAKINFQELDSVYDRGVLDGEYLEYFFSTPTIGKHVMMDYEPVNLRPLKGIFQKLRYDLHLKKIDTSINFRATPPPTPPEFR